MELRLEVVTVPVSDVDRAKAFYVDKVGFTADHDQVVHEGLRFVQLTPPNSACSIAIGIGLTDKDPGSAAGLMVVTPDVEATRAEFAERGLEVGEIDEQPWGRFVYFTDPDGNAWSVQELPSRG